MNGKEAALEQIAALTTAHGITVDEIKARLAQRDGSDGAPRGFLAQLLSYLGGAFVFSGISLLISFVWDDIGSAQRVVLTFGPGLAALLLGMLCVRDARFDRAATPLFLVLGLLAAVRSGGVPRRVRPAHRKPGEGGAGHRRPRWRPNRRWRSGCCDGAACCSSRLRSWRSRSPLGCSSVRWTETSWRSSSVSPCS